MFGYLILIIVNGIAFFLISKIMPGFKIKKGNTPFIVSFVYSLLGLLSSFILAPLVAIITVVLKIFAFIPIVGPIVAGGGLLATTFIVYFGVSAILLIIVDKIMDDFEMSSIFTAFGASFLLAILNVVIKAFLPGV